MVKHRIKPLTISSNLYTNTFLNIFPRCPSPHFCQRTHPFLTLISKFLWLLFRGSVSTSPVCWRGTRIDSSLVDSFRQFCVFVFFDGWFSDYFVVDWALILRPNFYQELVRWKGTWNEQTRNLDRFELGFGPRKFHPVWKLATPDESAFIDRGPQIRTVLWIEDFLLLSIKIVKFYEICRTYPWENLYS